MYISQEARKKIDESGAAISTFEELVYAISSFILRMWNTSPTDNTIAVLTKELVVDHRHSQFVSDLRHLLCSSLTVADIHTACRLAYDEFNSRIVRLHRANQCRENGDLEGYQTALPPLLLKLGSEIKKEAATGIIIPAGAK